MLFVVSLIPDLTFLRVRQVLCVGTQTVFIDNANEQHNMILLKHFTEKNHAAVVDVKTRKRKTGQCSTSTIKQQHYWKNIYILNPVCTFPSLTVKDYQLIQSQDSTTASLPGQSEGQGAAKTLLSRYLSNFTSIISHLLQTSQDNSSPDAVEASWVLSLALKGLYNTLKVCHS